MNKGRILIVDDQEEILESLGAILADEGHEVFHSVMARMLCILFRVTRLIWFFWIYGFPESMACRP